MKTQRAHSASRYAQIAGLLFTATAVVGCDTGLRTPICRPGYVDLPDGAAGAYRYWSTTANSALGGANTVTEAVDLVIAESNDSYEFKWESATPGLESRLVTRFAPRRAGASPTGASRTQTSRVSGPVVLGGFSACRIGGSYYWQTPGERGSYSLAKIDVTSTGITLSALAFNPDELKRARIPVHVLPSFGGFATWTGRTSNYYLFPPASLIVDNEGVTNEALLQLARPTSLGIILTKIPQPRSRPSAKAASMRAPKPGHT